MTRARNPRPQPAHVDESGRISRHWKSPTDFSYARCAILVGIISWLVAMKPANESFHQGTTTSSSFAMRRTTNYGLFCLQERTIQVVLHVGGQQWSCAYDEPLYGEWLCRDYLRDTMAHEKPLLWEATDRVYTLHRSIAWTLCCSTLLVACFATNPIRTTNSILGDTMLAILVDNRSHHKPLQSLLWKLLDLNMHIYPALTAMDHVILNQQPKSPFLLLPPPYNWYISLTLWFLLIVATNATTSFWSGGRPLLGFSAAAAAASGYLAQYRNRVGNSGIPWYTFPRSSPTGQSVAAISWSQVTWLTVTAVALRQSIPSAVAWLFLHSVAGQAWARWQCATLRSDYYTATLSWFAGLWG